MGRKKHLLKQEEKRVAHERVLILFGLAEKAFSLHPERANRYVQLARKLCLRFKVRLPVVLKRRMCKHCFSYLVPGKNCRVRTHEGKVVYACLVCKGLMRFPYR